MRLDTANRAFLALLVMGVTALVAIGLAACAVVAILAYRVGQDGTGVLTAEGAGVRPALVFLALVGAGAVSGLWALVVQVRATRALAARVGQASRALPPAVAEAAARAGMAGRVQLVDAPEAFSFTHGLGLPRVVVSRGLLSSLDPGELDAVLAHERYHVAQRDPLKVLLARTLAPTLFFLPALADLRARYMAGRELAADRRALGRCGRPALAGALYKVVAGPAWVQLGPAAAIGGSDGLDQRVHQLETGQELPPALSRRAVGLSAVGAGLLGWSAIASVLAFGGPAEMARRLCTGA
jgi:Zn-dependent protease with chaperone function